MSKQRALPTRIPNPTEAVILAIIAREHCYGLQIRERFVKLAKRDMPYGSLYATLHRMTDKGLIRSRVGQDTHASGGNRRRYFRITPKGRRAITALKRWLATMSKALQ